MVKKQKTFRIFNNLIIKSTRATVKNMFLQIAIHVLANYFHYNKCYFNKRNQFSQSFGYNISPSLCPDLVLVLLPARRRTLQPGVEVADNVVVVQFCQGLHLSHHLLPRLLTAANTKNLKNSKFEHKYCDYLSL